MLKQYITKDEINCSILYLQNREIIIGFSFCGIRNFNNFAKCFDKFMSEDYIK